MRCNTCHHVKESARCFMSCGCLSQELEERRKVWLRASVVHIVSEARRTDKTVAQVVDEMRLRFDETTCSACGAVTTDELSAQVGLCHRCVQRELIRKLEKSLSRGTRRTAPPQNPRAGRKRRRKGR